MNKFKKGDIVQVRLSKSDKEGHYSDYKHNEIAIVRRNEGNTTVFVTFAEDRGRPYPRASKREDYRVLKDEIKLISEDV